MMTTEQYYKEKLSVGSKLKRISDDRLFEVARIEDVKECGRDVRLYTLRTQAGYEFPFTSHAIEIGLEVTE